MAIHSLTFCRLRLAASLGRRADQLLGDGANAFLVAGLPGRGQARQVVVQLIQLRCEPLALLFCGRQLGLRSVELVFKRLYISRHRGDVALGGLVLGSEIGQRLFLLLDLALEFALLGSQEADLIFQFTDLCTGALEAPPCDA